MKIVCKILPLVLFFVSLATFSIAQRGNWNADPEVRAKEETAMMTEKLSLSAKQAEKVGEINLKYANKTKEARDANKEGDWSAMRETMMKIRTEQNDELKKIMTAAQFEQWQKIQEERRSQRQERGGPDGQRPKGKKAEENKG